jgi:hypothetical protein
MGLLLRAAIVVGVIYAASPVRDSAGPELGSARALVQDQAGRVGAAALDYCIANPVQCRSAVAAMAELDKTPKAETAGRPAVSSQISPNQSPVPLPTPRPRDLEARHPAQ